MTSFKIYINIHAYIFFCVLIEYAIGTHLEEKYLAGPSNPPAEGEEKSSQKY